MTTTQAAPDTAAVEQFLGTVATDVATTFHAATVALGDKLGLWAALAERPVTPDELAEADAHVIRYAANRALLLDGLPRLGVERVAPADGAFYVYADVAHLAADSMELTYRLLAETGIAVAPGIDFDPVAGHRWIRFSCAGATADVETALRRLAAWVSGPRDEPERGRPT